MKMTWHGDKAVRAVRDGGEDGVADAGQVIYEASQAVVPIESGELKRSGRVISDGLKSTVRYGEGLPDIRAGIVHEKLELHHDQGQPKYLENPTKASGPRVLEAIADGIRRKLK